MEKQNTAATASPVDCIVRLPSGKELSLSQVVAMVLEAFNDGFECGADHNNLPWKYPSVGLAWLFSESRSGLTRYVSIEQQTAMDEWSVKSIDSCDLEDPEHFVTFVCGD